MSTERWTQSEANEGLWSGDWSLERETTVFLDAMYRTWQGVDGDAEQMLLFGDKPDNDAYRVFVRINLPDTHDKRVEYLALLGARLARGYDLSWGILQAQAYQYSVKRTADGMYEKDLLSRKEVITVSAFETGGHGILACVPVSRDYDEGPMYLGDAVCETAYLQEDVKAGRAPKFDMRLPAAFVVGHDAGKAICRDIPGFKLSKEAAAESLGSTTTFDELRNSPEFEQIQKELRQRRAGEG